MSTRTMAESERSIRKLMIEATREGWFDVLRAKLPDNAHRRERMQFAHNEAVALFGTATIEAINQNVGTSEQVRETARRCASAGTKMHAWLLGETFLAN